MASAKSLMLSPESDFTARYELLEVLGEGSYSVVHRCVERSSGSLFACKVLALDSTTWQSTVAEIEASLRLKTHRNIAAVHEAFYGTDSLYVLMELCEGGDLLARINSLAGRGMTEAEAAPIFRDVVNAVQHCHSRDLAHRDVKPENVLLCPASRAADERGPQEKFSAALAGKDQPQPLSMKGQQTRAGSHRRFCSEGQALAGGDMLPAVRETAKLADFGLSAVVPTGKRVHSYAGSFPYVAPEVVTGDGCDTSADLWSLGVLLYAMLSASLPPVSADDDYEMDLEGAFRGPQWAQVSPAAQRLIGRLLTRDPAQRPRAPDVLADPWLTQACAAAEAQGAGAAAGAWGGVGSGALPEGLVQWVGRWGLELPVAWLGGLLAMAGAEGGGEGRQAAA